MSQGKKNRILKVMFFTVLGIVLFLALIQIAANIYLKVAFKKNINQIRNKISTEYRIEYDSITANIFNRSMTLKHFRLVPKGIHNQAIKKEISKGSSLYDLYLPVLKVTGIDIVKAVLHQSLDVKKILIKDGKMEIIKIGSSDQVISKKKGAGDILVLNRFPFNRIRIKEIKIDNFSFNPKQNINNPSELKTVNLSLRLTDLLFKFKRPKNRKIRPNVKVSFSTNVEGLEVVFPGKMYTLRVEKMVISEPLSRIKISSLKLIPAYKKYIFSRKKGYRTSRVNWTIDKLNFFKVKFEDIFKKRCFQSDLINITGSRIRFFRDRRVRRRRKLFPKKFPQEIFRDIKYFFKIKKIKILEGYVSYEEHQSGLLKPGKVDFHNININVLNLSNYQEGEKPNPPVTMELSSTFLGKALFKVSMVVPVHDRDNSFSLSGSLGTLQLTHLNPILKNSFLKVENGAVKKLLFYAWGNRYLARGTLKFYYNDLKVSLLKKRRKIKRDGAASFIANRFLKNDNPKQGRPLRIGYMYYKRVLTDSMLKLIWKSFLSGVKSSVGL